MSPAWTQEVSDRRTKIAHSAFRLCLPDAREPAPEHSVRAHIPRPGGVRPRAASPGLTLTLRNRSGRAVAFTIRHNQYIAGRPETVKVGARGSKTWTVNPLKVSHGWYDVTVTADVDAGWSQRYVGHLETGRPSITG